MNRFYVIGLDDNMKQYFPPEVLEISSHRVFSGGVRHHEIVRSLLPEKADWIDIKVPLDEVFDRYRSHDGRESIVVFASGDPLFFGFAVTIQNRLPDAQIRLYLATLGAKSIDALPRHADRLPYRKALARVRSCLDRKCV